MKSQLIVFLSLWAVVSAHAGSLNWKSTRLEAAPGEGTEQAIAIFEFTNSGKEAVAIKSASSSCSECTDLVFKAEPVPPGGKAELIATVNTKGINGRSIKIITVETTEPDAKPDRLELVVLVPEKLSVSAKNTRWDAGDMAAKNIEITTLLSSAVPYIMEVRPEGLFSATIAKGANGNGHSLVLIPQGEIKHSRRALIKIAVKDEKLSLIHI